MLPLHVQAHREGKLMLPKKARSIIRECLPPIVVRLIRSARSSGTKKFYPFEGDEQSAASYDRVFVKHDHWRRHYTESPYFPVWTVIADRISRSQVNSILDIGCGSGQVAQLLHDKGLKNYLGIDFSVERICQARLVCPEFRFVVADIFETDLLSHHDYDGVVCLEFLEHVERDLQLIQNLRPGTLFWASVPNFGGKAHVRYFNSIEEVVQRYADYFDDFRVDEQFADSKGKKFFILEGVKQSKCP